MTTSQMVSWFDVLQDKNGSAYWTDAEKLQFLNRAQIEFVNELLPTKSTRNNVTGMEALVNLELSQDTQNKIAPLIFNLPSLTMSSAGIITKAAVAASLNSLSTGAIMWRPLSVGLTYGSLKVPVKWMRHNDRWEFEKYVFKKPTIQNPRYSETYNSYIFAPVNTGAQIYFTLLKYPKEMTLSPEVNSDLPDFTHDKIVAIALEFAGVGSRDTTLTELLQLKQRNGE